MQLQINPTGTIYLATEAVDFRKAFDGLSGVIRDYLGKDPLSGDIFMFFNRRRNRVKLLVWDGDGFWLYYKRLEEGTFEYPLNTQADERYQELLQEQLYFILSGVELSSIKKRKRYKKCA
jgi:transposase